MPSTSSPIGVCLTRRDAFRFGLAGTLGMSGLFSRVAAQVAGDPQRLRSCILLWMSGGPSQMDTFDTKPAHANGGPIRSIETAAPGIRISEHLPRLAAQMNRLAVVRSMSTREGDHGRATYHLRTGYVAMPPIQYPTLGALVGKERDRPDDDLPSYVSIGFAGPTSQGFLGPRFAPLQVGQAGEIGGENALRVQNATRPSSVSRERFEDRL